MDPLNHYTLDLAPEARALAALSPTLRRVETVPLISFAEARLHLKLDPLPVDENGQLVPDEEVEPHPDDALVKGAVAAAQAEVEGPLSFTHRGASASTWELALNAWPAGLLPLPLPPVQEIVSVTYLDAQGDEVTVDAGLYGLAAMGGTQAVWLKPGNAWPEIPAAVRGHPGAVKVRFKTGYEPGHPDGELIKAYAKLRLGMLYENREGVVVGTSATPLPGWAHMLENLRVAGSPYLMGAK